MPAIDTISNSSIKDSHYVLILRCDVLARLSLMLYEAEVHKGLSINRDLIALYILSFNLECYHMENKIDNKKFKMIKNLD